VSESESEVAVLMTCDENKLEIRAPSESAYEAIRHGNNPAEMEEMLALKTSRVEVPFQLAKLTLFLLVWQIRMKKGWKGKTLWLLSSSTEFGSQLRV
jgi:hypothetical protein